jgi:rRNA maturation endonuclease Nob1
MEGLYGTTSIVEHDEECYACENKQPAKSKCDVCGGRGTLTYSEEAR